MSEVTVAHEKRELTPQEIEGLGKLIVTVSASHTEAYLAGLVKLHPSLTRYVGLKLPSEATLPVMKKSISTGIPQRTGETFVRGATNLFEKISTTKGFRELWIDTNFSKDGHELIASVDRAVSKYENFISLREASKQAEDRNLEQDRRVRLGLPPKFVSILMSHMSDIGELSEAVEHTRNHFTPFAVVSSSKQDSKTNVKYGFDHKALTASMALMALDSGITHMAGAASDSILIRDALSGHTRYDEVVIIGYGTILDDTDTGEHDDTILVEKVKHAVDYFGVGTAVLLHDNPDIHLLDYANAIAA